MLSHAITDVLALGDHDSPDHINHTFGALIACIAASPDGAEHAVPEATKRQLREKMSQLESRVEAQWAHDIISSADPAATLATFSHHDRYAELDALSDETFAAWRQHEYHRDAEGRVAKWQSYQP